MNKSTASLVTPTTIQSKAEDFPHILRNIPDPPRQLYLITSNWSDLLARPWVAIVGSRKVTDYGKLVTTRLASDLAASGIVIASGLAIGVDGVAHQAALQKGGLTVAVLAGGLDYIHPSCHRRLAQQIIGRGGALISEYPLGIPSYPKHFIARNRLVSGLSQAVVITEAAQKSGTLHTARFALEQGREVFAVPGNITSSTSVATNNLIKSGATPVTDSQDILRYLGIQSGPSKPPTGATPNEQLLLNLLHTGETESATLLTKSNLSVQQFNQTLTMLEITGAVRPLGNNHWTIH